MARRLFGAPRGFLPSRLAQNDLNLAHFAQSAIRFKILWKFCVYLERTMMEDLLAQLLEAQDELDPQFKALRGTMSSLKTAVRLASAEKPDALPMHKALLKLEAASADVESEHLHEAVAAFSAVTQNALDDFAKDLRESLAQRSIEVEGRPPVLTVGDLIFKIEMASRKGQWLYGKEPLTKPIPLSLTGILKAYARIVKCVVDRKLDSNFLPELQQAWQDTLDKRKNGLAVGD